jgi:hypothetical protein
MMFRQTKSRLPEVRERILPMDSGFAAWPVIGPAVLIPSPTVSNYSRFVPDLLQREISNISSMIAMNSNVLIHIRTVRFAGICRNFIHRSNIGQTKNGT